MRAQSFHLPFTANICLTSKQLHDNTSNEKGQKQKSLHLCVPLKPMSAAPRRRDWHRVLVVMAIALFVAKQLVVCLGDIHHGNERYTERIAKHGEDDEGEVTEDDDDVTTWNGVWCHYGGNSLYVGLIWSVFHKTTPTWRVVQGVRPSLFLLMYTFPWVFNLCSPPQPAYSIHFSTKLSDIWLKMSLKIVFAFVTLKSRTWFRLILKPV